jgi:hypothetical protein
MAILLTIQRAKCPNHCWNILHRERRQSADINEWKDAGRALHSTRWHSKKQGGNCFCNKFIAIPPHEMNDMV